MPVDPQVQALLDQMTASNTPDFYQQAVEENRQGLRTMFTAETPTPIARVENRKVPSPDGDIPVRVYTPEGSGPFPILVYFHGGGWVIGDLDTHDELCRNLANEANCIVVAVDYRLAPEHKFPACTEDCYAATKWVAENASQFNGDSSRIAVGGDSAGGNLTAVVALMARDRGGPPLVFQLLLYPVTDLRLNTASMEENAEGYFLTKQDMIWFINHYVNNEEDKQNPLASPMLATNLSGLPPALVITAEYDPLRDEGELYGKRLKEAGVSTTISRYDGMIHAFLSLWAVLDKGKQGVTECCEALKAAFQAKTTTSA